MNIKEMKVLINSLEDMGFKNIDLMYDNGRDGFEDLVLIDGRIKKNSDGVIQVVFHDA